LHQAKDSQAEKWRKKKISSTLLAMEHISKCHKTVKTPPYLQIPVIHASAMAVVNSVDQLLEIFPRVVLLQPSSGNLDPES
jgi:hypothetical protein